MKKIPFALLALLCCYALLVTVCTKQVLLTADPIVTLGHGSIIGEDGRNIEPTAKFIESVQKFYLQKLLDANKNKAGRNPLSEAEIETTRKVIFSEVGDKILANALFIDWLLEKTQPQDLAHLTTVNNALRWQYVLKIQKDGVLPVNNEWGKGLQPEVAKRLEAKIGVKIYALTNTAGEAYCRECVEAGVPVPKFMFGEEWKFVGEVEDEFLSPGMRAELWIYESKSPQGVCLALPRFEAGSDRASLFGVICLGTQTSKACFFDNPAGKAFQRNVRVDFKEFVGGTDLVANAQGVCSDCHAGENPYVVHPEKPAFVAVLNKIQSIAWHDPLVDASWPQNPGPSNLLDAVASPGKCDDCHRVGSAGRFPEVSNQLPGYCGIVLTKAADLGSSQRTMPPYGADRDLYSAHYDALKSSCGTPPSGGGVEVPVNYPEDKAFISPPIVIDPLYQCATSVAVRGAVLDAKVELLVNGSSVGAIAPARNTYFIEFTGLAALKVGDIVTARQEKNGVVSAESPAITVRDHKVDFPAGLPAPTVDPGLIYECAEIIAVRHVPGATVKVYKNGVGVTSGTGSTGWTGFWAGGPIAVGDKFTAEISLCTDASPMSASVSAVAAPGTIPPAQFNPPSVYAGQELVTIINLTNGTQTKIEEVSFGPLGGFSTPISWFNDFDIKTPLGRALLLGETLRATQKLCKVISRSETPKAVSCEELPAPRIQHPIVGTNFVVVSQSVPGARIRVYDGGGIEIGDGSGSVIVLSRTITGADILTVVQQVGECTSKNGYRVSVRNPGSNKKEGK